jgi:hypothetical protein
MLRVVWMLLTTECRFLIIMLCCHSEYCFAECRYAECCYAEFVMRSVVMPSVILLSVVMLSLIILYVNMLSVIMLCVVMLSVVMPRVIVLSVVAPFKQFYNVSIEYVHSSSTETFCQAIDLKATEENFSKWYSVKKKGFKNLNHLFHFWKLFKDRKYRTLAWEFVFYFRIWVKQCFFYKC